MMHSASMLRGCALPDVAVVAIAEYVSMHFWTKASWRAWHWKETRKKSTPSARALYESKTMSSCRQIQVTWCDTFEAWVYRPSSAYADIHFHWLPSSIQLLNILRRPNLQEIWKLMCSPIFFRNAIQQKRLKKANMTMRLECRRQKCLQAMWKEPQLIDAQALTARQKS